MKTRKDYEEDIYYEVWRRGGNPDLIDLDNFDPIDDDFDVDAIVERELARQRIGDN